MDPEERDRLLIRVDERTEQMYRAVFGNGRPGLVEHVAVLQDDMRRREAEAEEFRGRVPTRKDKALVNSGVLTAIMIAVLAAVKAVFFSS